MGPAGRMSGDTKEDVEIVCLLACIVPKISVHRPHVGTSTAFLCRALSKPTKTARAVPVGGIALVI